MKINPFVSAGKGADFQGMFPQLLVDFDGQDRPGASIDAGADQISGGP